MNVKPESDTESARLKPAAGAAGSSTSPSPRGGIGEYFSGRRTPPKNPAGAVPALPQAQGDPTKSEIGAPVGGGLLPNSDGSDLAPMTEVAFTELPAELDMGTGGRRQLSATDLPEALEDCALSFANGDAEEALARLDAALSSGELKSNEVQAWLIRFDLYLELDMKEAFEREALRFATLFERTPPVWDDESGDEDDWDNLIVPSVAITGALSRESQAPLSALRKTVERYEGVRLDFERLDGADSEGCRCLLVTVQALRRAGKAVRLVNEQRLLDVLAPGLRAGDSTGDPVVWLLALEVLQARDEETHFEDLAIQYATTFEVSPPSWQSTPGKAEARPRRDVAEPRFTLQGEVVQPLVGLLERLEVYITQHEEVVIDMSHLSRIDFISCGQLASVLAKAHQAGRRIEIRSPNEMTAALLVLIGAAEFATIVPRR
jgi:ABC-type transporter Mla MlaB component